MSSAVRLTLLSVALLLAASGVRAASEQRAMEPAVADALSRVIDMAQEDPHAALEELARLMRRYARRPHQLVYIMHQRAGLLLETEQIDLARQELAALLDDRPPDFALPLKLTYAKVLLLADELETARTVLEGWREHTPQRTGGGLFLLGYTYLRLDQFDAAVAPLEEAVTVSERPLTTWIELLAYCYARVDRADDGVALLEDLIRRDPSRPRWWRHLAALYQTVDDVPKGTAIYTVLEQLGELSLQDSRGLAGMMGYLGMPYDGAVVWESAMLADGDGATYSDHMFLAKLWMSAREFERASAALEAAAVLADDGEPYMLMGQLHLHWERYEPAIAAFKRAVTHYAEDVPAQTYYLLAVAAVNVKRYQEARLALMQIEQDRRYADRAARLMRQIQRSQSN